MLVSTSWLAMMQIGEVTQLIENLQNAIYWSCKKQSIQQLPGHPLSHNCLNRNWDSMVQHLLDELGFPAHQSPNIFSGNIEAAYLCANLVFHSPKKHLAIVYHFVHDLVASNKLQLSHFHQVIILLMCFPNLYLSLGTFLFLF